MSTATASASAISARVGDLVLDPFGGIGSTAYCAVRMGRRAYTIELSQEYHQDALAYLRAAEAELSMPTLFNALDDSHDSDINTKPRAS